VADIANLKIQASKLVKNIKYYIFLMIIMVGDL
jgi:hypothetical protein